MIKLSVGLQPKIRNQNLPFEKYNFLQIIKQDLYWIPSIPMINVLVLIICLIRIASLSLAAFHKEISFGKSASSSEMNQLIMKWRKSYFLVRDLVSAMNAFFGQPIIIIVFVTMLSAINLTFGVIIKIKMNNYEYLADNIQEIVTNIICLSLLAFVSEQIPQQVS